MFLIQDGHQTHTRVRAAIEAEVADGVVWSPGDETPQNLEEVIDTLEGTGVVQAIDPQLYVAPLQDASPKKLPRHGLFELPMIARDFAGRRMVSLVSTVLDHQSAKPVSHILSPTVSIGSMNTRWAQIAFELGETSLEDWAARKDERPLLLSVAIEESLLADEDNVDALLDELTGYDCDGFYLLFELPPDKDPASLTLLYERALYIVYALSELNEYAVWVAYAGLGGYAFRSVGAEATGAGWFRKQQWWSPTHWTGSGGGRQPRPRIYLDSLLGSVLVDTELALVENGDSALFAELVGGAGELADEFHQGRDFGADIARPECVLQLFAVCKELDARITRNVARDVKRVLRDIAGAEALYRQVADIDVQLDSRGGSKLLTVWQTALVSLSGSVGLAI